MSKCSGLSPDVGGLYIIIILRAALAVQKGVLRALEVIWEFV